MDLPAIDRRHLGRPVRHGWCTTFDDEGRYGFDFAGINHVDVKTGEHDRWEPGEMERAGEAFFVADGEGEGWVMSFLYDRTVDRSSLGIFDARFVVWPCRCGASGLWVLRGWWTRTGMFGCRPWT
jgi:carotenoid cleavage dioxygenase-like enzyme